MFTLLLISVVPIAVTIFLPRKWLLLWLPILGGAFFWLLESLDEADGPSGFAAYAFVGFFLMTNLPALAARLMFVLGALNAEFSRGYSE
jgi:hypothetical protein